MTEQGFPVNSRFRITASPEVLPGKCAVCGAVDRPVIDFSTTIPLYGAILVCFSCLSEAARGIGMVPETDFKAVQENLAQSLKEQLNAANMIGVPRERYDAIVVAVSGLSDAILFSSNSDTALVAGPHGEIQPPLFDDATADNSDSEGYIEGSVGSSEQNDNPAVGERSTSISSSSGDGISRIRTV